MTDFLVIALLLYQPVPGQPPLQAELHPRILLRAASLEECDRVHAPRIADERARQYAADVQRTRGRVIAICVPAGPLT